MEKTGVQQKAVSLEVFFCGKLFEETKRLFLCLSAFYKNIRKTFEHILFL
jgi:hypothetical protein